MTLVFDEYKISVLNDGKPESIGIDAGNPLAIGKQFFFIWG